MYWSTFCAVMVNSGFSLANGSERKPLLSTEPAFFARPPVQAGMLPSALPAFSAPIGVSEVPSLAASLAETAAMTWVASRLSASAPVCSRIFFVVVIIACPR
ncbi:hypothetical protein D3C81_1593390 [compost metagenome]